MLKLALITPLVALATFAQPARADTWRWPAQGEVLTPYRNGDDPYAAGQHRGIDIGAPTGSPVVAAVAGTVRFAGVAGTSGTTVSVRTGDEGFDVSYLHLASLDVRKGQVVSAGDLLGSIGTSGRRSTEAPHLHFGVREAGSRHAYRDPLGFLPSPPAPPAEPEGPRGAPAPAPAPVARAPEPVPVSPVPVPAPHRVPLGRRVPARRGVPVGRRVPAGRRVPVSRRSPAPARRRAPAERRAPQGRLEDAPALQGVHRPQRAPAPARPSSRAGATPRLSARGSAAGSLGAGSALVPDQLPSDRRALPPASPAERQPEPSGSSALPDIGWAIACLGLLLAAACIGTRSGQAREAAGRGRSALAALLRPLTGRG